VLDPGSIPGSGTTFEAPTRMRHLLADAVNWVDSIPSVTMASQTPPTSVAASDFKTSRFSMHGEVTLTTDGNILLYESTGPFNVETIQAFTTARASIHKAIDSTRPYAAIVHWRNSALMPLEAFAAYQDGYVSFLRENRHPLLLAWVFGPEVEGMDFMIARFRHIFDEHRLNFRSFSTAADARKWVDSYKINP
jgi:hypothetical protein